MLASLLIKTVSGAVVGYLTNDLAIDMLFRKRFGLGGIFLKTRDEFIENISKVVENDIINHHTLESEIKKEAFIVAIHTIVRSYFEEMLVSEESSLLRLEEIPHIETSFSQIKNTFISHIPLAMQPVISQLASSILVTDVISEKQLQHLGGKITDTFAEKTANYQVVSKFIRNFYEEAHQKPLSSFLDQHFTQQSATNIAAVAYSAEELLHQYADEVIEKTLSALEIQHLIQTLALRFAEKPVYDILGKKNAENLAGEILRQLQIIMASPEGEKIFDAFSDFLIHTLENEKSTIFDLLSEDITINIRNFFNYRFPIILGKIIDWLQGEQKEIEKLVDITFAQHLESRFKGWLVDTFVGSVSQSANVVVKVSELIESYRQNPEKITQTITQQITDFLSQQSIGNIIKGLKDQNTVVTFSKILQKNIVDALGNFKGDGFAPFFEKKLGNYIAAKEIEDFLYRTLAALINNQIKPLLTEDKRFLLGLAANIQSQIVKATEQPIGNIISPNWVQNFAVRSENYALALIQQNKNLIQPFLYHNLWVQIEKMRWNQFLSAQQTSDFATYIAQNIDIFLENQFASLKKNHLHTYIHGFNTIPNLHLQIGDSIHTTLSNNLASIVEGRIEEVVRTNLRNQSPNQIRDMVERFMGKELKPITILGGWLGGLAGLGLGFVPELQNVAAQVGMASLAYGVTGMGTNWLALKMIFQPYYQKKIGGMNVPFTPGVAIKNQKRFAQNMGNFVSQKLMSKEGLREAFAKRKDLIAQSVVQQLSQNDYEAVQKLLYTHKDFIAQKVSTYLWDYVQQSRSSTIENLLFSVEKYKESNLLVLETASIEQKIIHYLRQPSATQKVTDELYKHIEAFIKQDQKLVDAIPESFQKIISQTGDKFITDKFDALFDTLKQTETINRLVEQLEDVFNLTVQKKITNFITPAQEKLVAQKLASFLASQLQNEENRSRVFEYIDKKLSEQIAPEKQIKEIFDGKLLHFVNVNLDFIIQKVMDSAIVWLRSNSEKLADSVYEKAFEEQKASLFYKSAIRKTVIDLACVGIPQFLEQKKESINTIVNEEIKMLGDLQLEQLGIDFDDSYIKNIIQNITQSQRTLNSIEQLSVSLMQSFYEIPLATLLQLTTIQSIRDVQSILKDEIQLIMTHLRATYLQNRTEFLEIYTVLLQYLLEKVLENNTVSSLIDEIPSSLIKQNLATIVETVLQSDTFETQAYRLVSKLFEDIKGQKIGDTLDWELLKKDIEKVIHTTLDMPFAEKLFMETSKNLIIPNLSMLNQNIRPETKAFLLALLTQAATQVLDKHLPSVLDAIDIQRIVVEEIEKMPPQEIEQLFNGFAKKYFDQLVNYGFSFGIAFGLAMDYALILAYTLLTK